MPGWIAVSADGRGFTDTATGRPFVPFGANYFPPKGGWFPKLWSQYDHATVARQFGQIAQAGLNCVRVFLDVSALAPGERQYSEAGFAKVDDLVETAGQLGLRIDFSGPNFLEGRPEYRKGDEYADPHQMDLICDLWRQLAERYGNNPTIMTWDLRNEPRVRWLTRDNATAACRLKAWQACAKDRLGIEVDDFPEYGREEPRILRAYVRFLEDLAENWVRRQCQALRSAGARQMISVGNVQWAVPVFIAKDAHYASFNPARIEKYLDYMSIHFYPILLNVREGLEPELSLQKAYLEIVARGSYIPGKPLVMEEFGWKGGRLVPNETRVWPEEHQSLWGDLFMEVTSRVASGWLNWGYADCDDPKTDISAASGLWTADERLKHWGRRFAEHARHFTANPPAYRPAEKRWTVDRMEHLLRHNGRPPLQWLQDQLATDPADSVELVFTDEP